MRFLIAILTVLLTVGIHFEAAVLARDFTLRWRELGRLRVAIAVAWMVLAHIVEVVIFAMSWAALIAWEGALLSPASENFEDLVYFSGAVYTSLGFGDVVPVGNARVFAVIEAVTGLVLIAWTASFTFLEMRDWDDRRR